MARKNIRSAKMAAKLEQIASSAKRAAQARTAKPASTAAVKKMIRDNEKALERFGTKQMFFNGTTIYATKSVAIEIKPEHVRGAKPQIDNNCPVACSVRDSVLGPYITDAHVGNATVKVWSDLNPDVELKFLLSDELHGAVYKYDTKKRWPLKPGVYWLMPYPRSLRRGYKTRRPGSRTAAARKRSPSRHISLRKDIGRARAAADGVTKNAKKRR